MCACACVRVCVCVWVCVCVCAAARDWVRVCVARQIQAAGGCAIRARGRTRLDERARDTH